MNWNHIKFYILNKFSFINYNETKKIVFFMGKAKITFVHKVLVFPS